MLNEILLIDDSRGTNSLNKRLLEELNIAKKVSTASNGMQALDYLISLNDDGGFPKPDLIYLDINMPVMDGYQFLEKFTELKNTVQTDNSVFMLSSSASEIDLTKSSSFSIVKGYQTKPLTPEKVFESLKSLK